MQIPGLSRLKVQGKLVAAMLAAGLLPLAISGALNYQEAKSELSESATGELHAVAEAKRQAIESYFQLIRDQVTTLAEDHSVSDGLAELSDAFDTLADEETAAGLSQAEADAAVNGQFTGVFSAEYAKQSGKPPALGSFTLENPAARVEQYQ